MNPTSSDSKTLIYHMENKCPHFYCYCTICSDRILMVWGHASQQIRSHCEMEKRALDLFPFQTKVSTGGKILLYSSVVSCQVRIFDLCSCLEINLLFFLFNVKTLLEVLL